MLSSDLSELQRNRPILLRNLTCVYCGCELATEASTKEHIVGRRFVPRGTLDRDWNLIVRACKACNVRKSDLEDDISAITMHPDAFGQNASEHSQADAERKGSGSRSRKTGKPVGESTEHLKLQVPVGHLGTMSVDFTAPPQIEARRAYELARMQMVAFFYFLTYKAAANRGHYWPGDFYPVMEARRADWGNPIHRAFISTVKDWEPAFSLPRPLITTPPSSADIQRLSAGRGPSSGTRATDWSGSLASSRRLKMSLMRFQS